ncbi:MAG: aminotransferase class I/II-fold pyridoxal phosphate-dependent enzyme [Bacteroidales bacterium]|nr:aminotransferase class I/II-fold pyridoxal phosphate-dependent enzyme [Bacteroidales bacterium]
MDLFKKIDDTRGGALGKYQEVAHGYFAFPKLEGEIEPMMIFRGKKVLNWSMENYLGLANDPDVRQADTTATQKWGLGYPMGTRIISGQTTMHEELEDAVARFMDTEDAFVVNYGYQAMVSAIDTLCNRFDVIVYDSLANASITDGILLHRAKGGKCFVYAHNDVDNLRKKLSLAESYISKEPHEGGIMVVTDGVFDTAGDIAPLDKIAALKSEFEFSLLVDDAHGFGVLGPNGRGTAEMLGVSDKVDLIFGSCTKAMAGIGGFIVGKEKIINYLRYNMRSQIFDESLPLAMILGLQKRLELLTTQPERRAKLWEVTNALQKGLREAGYDLGPTQSAITPIYIHPKVAVDIENKNAGVSEDDLAINSALNLVMDMRENYGIFCTIVKYPAVPPGTLMIRFMPTASHTLENVEYTVQSMVEMKKKLDEGAYDNQTLLK